MGVYWARTAAARFPGHIEIIDLRTLFPLDEELVYSTVRRHGKCLVLTEEQQTHSFAQAFAWRITRTCFTVPAPPVEVVAAPHLPAVPMNTGLENAMLPNPAKVAAVVEQLLNG